MKRRMVSDGTRMISEVSHDGVTWYEEGKPPLRVVSDWDDEPTRPWGKLGDDDDEVVYSGPKGGAA